MRSSALTRARVTLLAACLVSLSGAAAAEGPNEILQLLLTTGVPLGDGQSVRLPEPTLGDGLPAEAQRQRIEALAAGRNAWEDLTRRSVVAPFILKIAANDAQPQGVGRRVDLWFVAYGTLPALADGEFFRGQFPTAADDPDTRGTARLLTDADLQKRGLAVPVAATDPRFVAAETSLLDRVLVNATTCSVKTQTADTLLVASLMDPRFAADAEFPNRWCAIVRDESGARRYGEPHAYLGLGSYMKATRLAEPQGALLIEYHLAYAEPEAWFGGANLLRSKLPILAQSVVRKVRRSLLAP